MSSLPIRRYDQTIAATATARRSARISLSDSARGFYVEPDRPRVLVAHALASYAEPLATLLAEMRPGLDVRQVAPAELDAAVVANPGAVVISDWISPAAAANAGGWLLYYPDHENVAIVGGQCPPRRINVPWFPDILAMIDDLVAGRFAVRSIDEPATSPVEW